MQRTDKRASLKTPLLAGATIAALFFAGFGGWAATAPLAGAAIAPGVVIPEGKRKTVQHLEGGLVQAILVREGSRVEAGEPLLRLDNTQALAEHEALLGRWQANKASELRLLAERAGSAQVVVPDELLALARRDARFGDRLQAEQARLEARRVSLGDQIAVLRKHIAAGAEEIHGLHEMIASQGQQLRLIAEELAGVRTLFEKGLEKKPRLLAIERAMSQIEGQRGANQAEIARAEQRIAAAQMQIASLESERAEEVADRLAEVQAELAVLEEKLRMSSDRLERIEVRAPVSGIVVELQVKTPGAVIGPGQPLMDIVPFGEELIIEARVAPTDIDEVHAGLTAQVHLLAYRSRNLPRIDGVVRAVSADRLVDEHSGQPYFAARVAVDPASLPESVVLAAGMPAETLILTGSRTLLEYLLQPLRDVLRHGMRET